MVEDLQGFKTIRETLGEDSQTLGEDLIHETLGEDSLWEGFAQYFGKRIDTDLQYFGRGFTRIHETLGEDSQDFGRGFARIH